MFASRNTKTCFHDLSFAVTATTIYTGYLKKVGPETSNKINKITENISVSILFCFSTRSLVCFLVLVRALQLYQSRFLLCQRTRNDKLLSLNVAINFDMYFCLYSSCRQSWRIHVSFFFVHLCIIM